MTKYFFSQLTLNWYHKNGRKNLPWQKNKTLYTVWISEIMLQQTTVKFVIPYFKRFILKFPDLQTLLNAQLDEILYLWSGLGYYKRARNIYKSAQIIKIKHQGIFPDQFSDIIKLPGIGRSTAGAILSLSLNFFYPILDGNVKRILMRYYGIIGYIQDKKIEKKLWNIIESIIPVHHTDKFNQSLMDIGSFICTPIQPKCNICPLNQTCITQKKQEWKKYPLKKKKQKLPKKTFWFVLIEFNNTFWMEKNTEEKIWKNLFCFPKFDTEKIALNWLKEKKTNIVLYEKMISFEHRFSHFILNIHSILIKTSCISKYYKEHKQGIWYNLKNPQHIGLPNPVEKILRFLKKNKKKREY